MNRKHYNKKKVLQQVLLCIVLMFLAGCGASGKNPGTSSPFAGKTSKYTMTDFVMDTVLNITLYGEEDATSDIKTLLNELENKELSWRIEDSMASQINQGCQKGNSVTMDEDFASWTRASIALAQKSGGAFDPTIGNLTRLWNIEGENPVVPPQEEIDACLKDIGYQHINIEENDITMSEGSSLDLGAVGKGIGCDVVKEKLKELPVTGAVVAIGGSILVYGNKPDGSDWNVAVQDPNGEDGAPMGVISLSGEKFVSTSGDYEKYFEEDGIRYHHILDPATGYPSQSGLRSVTIVCDNGLLSDGLSTACFILGEEKGMELAKEFGAEVIMINKENQVLVSDGLKEDFKIIEYSYKMKGE